LPFPNSGTKLIVIAVAPVEFVTLALGLLLMRQKITMVWAFLQISWIGVTEVPKMSSLQEC
jgi:hypothetical protein